MNQKNPEEPSDYLSSILRQYVEKKHYNLLNQGEHWNNFLKELLTRNYPVQENIEMYADTGLINLQRITSYALKNFDTFWNIFVGDSCQQPLFVKYYLCLFAYLQNISILPVKPRRKIEANDISSYFTKNVHETLSLVYKELPDSIKEVLGQLTKATNNQLTPETILLELILIAKVKSRNHPFFSCIQEKQLLKNSMQEHILSLVNNKVIDRLNLDYYYSNFDHGSFSWLDTENHTTAIVDALFHTLIIFHTAKNIYDLQGTNKEFGYYQRLFDAQYACILYSINYDNNISLLKGNSAIIAGMCNINMIEILENGDILLSFRTNNFASNNILERAALNAALCIVEYLADYFRKTITGSIPQLLLIKTQGEFTLRITEQLEYIAPEICKHTHIVPELTNCSKIERDIYLYTKKITLTETLRNTIIDTMIKHKYSFPAHMTKRAFNDAKVIELNKGDVLCEENSLAAFIYIPLSSGLKGYSKKSEIEFYPNAFMPIGQIAVIEQGRRTATIFAEKTIQLLMLSSEVYLKYWKREYTEKELISLILKPENDI